MERHSAIEAVARLGPFEKQALLAARAQFICVSGAGVYTGALVGVGEVEVLDPGPPFPAVVTAFVGRIGGPLAGVDAGRAGAQRNGLGERGVGRRDAPGIAWFIHDAGGGAALA